MTEIRVRVQPNQVAWLALHGGKAGAERADESTVHVARAGWSVTKAVRTHLPLAE